MLNQLLEFQTWCYFYVNYASMWPIFFSSGWSHLIDKVSIEMNGYRKLPKGPVWNQYIFLECFWWLHLRRSSKKTLKIKSFRWSNIAVHVVLYSSWAEDWEDFLGSTWSGEFSRHLVFLYALCKTLTAGL